MGLPSVAFDVGGMREVIDDGVTGLLVTPGKHEGFCRATLELLTNATDRIRMGCTARAQFRQRFDIHKIAAGYAELFNS